MSEDASGRSDFTKRSNFRSVPEYRDFIFDKISIFDALRHFLL